MWCWRRMEKFSWPNHVRNEEVLLRVSEQRNILHEIRKWKAKWIGHILRRNCLLKQVIEGKIKGEMEVTRRWGRRHKKLLDDLKDRRGYCHLKEEALDHTMWRNRFGGGFGPVVRQNTEWMNELVNKMIMDAKHGFTCSYFLHTKLGKVIDGKAVQWLARTTVHVKIQAFRTSSYEGLYCLGDENECKYLRNIHMKVPWKLQDLSHFFLDFLALY